MLGSLLILFDKEMYNSGAFLGTARKFRHRQCIGLVLTPVGWFAYP